MFLSSLSIFLNASGVFLVSAPNFLNNPCIVRERFCDDVFCYFEFFWVSFFSVALFMYLSHADGVPITDPRLLKPFTFEILVTSNTLMVHYRRFFFLMS